MFSGSLTIVKLVANAFNVERVPILPIETAQLQNVAPFELLYAQVDDDGSLRAVQFDQGDQGGSEQALDEFRVRAAVVWD